MANETEENIIHKYLYATIVILISFLLCVEGFGAPGHKTWSYEIKSVETESSDPALMSTSLKVDRISRGVYAISGDVIINYDIADGDDNLIAAKSFRSPNSDGDFASLPFQMAPSHWHKVLNTHYKDVLMETLKGCSDLPVFEGDFVPPLEKKKYELKQCQFSQDGLPNHLQDGLYKLDIIGTGTVDWKIEVIAEVTPEM